MPCDVRRIPGGVVIACSRGPRQKCAEPGCHAGVVALCDYPLDGPLKGRTCDRGMCDLHRAPQGVEGVDFCPPHARIRKESGR